MHRPYRRTWANHVFAAREGHGLDGVTFARVNDAEIPVGTARNRSRLPAVIPAREERLVKKITLVNRLSLC
jgi:hypothetical protein